MYDSRLNAPSVPSPPTDPLPSKPAANPGSEAASLEALLRADPVYSNKMAGGMRWMFDDGLSVLPRKSSPVEPGRLSCMQQAPCISLFFNALLLVN